MEFPAISFLTTMESGDFICTPMENTMRTRQDQVVIRTTSSAFAEVFDSIEGWPDWMEGLISADCSHATQQVGSHIYALYALGENDYDVIIDVTQHKTGMRTVHEWSGMISGTVTWTMQANGSALTVHVDAKLQIGESVMPDSAVRFEAEHKLVDNLQPTLAALKTRLAG